MNHQKLLLASIMLVVASGLMTVGTAGTITNVHGQVYDFDYGNDHYKVYQESKSSHDDIQKISCVNSNTNVNGIDITEIPPNPTAQAAANEAGPDAANTQNGNGFDKIKFNKNLVNICLNLNFNKQVNIDQLTCEDCFTENLDEQELQALEDELATGTQFGLLDGLCEFLVTGTESKAIKAETVIIILGQAGISEGDQQTVLECLADLGLIEFPRPPD